MPSLPDEGQTSESLERILDAATVLFARHGYHGVSMRALSARVGLNISTINYHIGSKKALYHRVFHRLFLREFELVSKFAGFVDDDVVHDPHQLRDLLEQLVDALIDLTLERPEVPRLWVRRWLEFDRCQGLFCRTVCKQVQPRLRP